MGLSIWPLWDKFISLNFLMEGWSTVSKGDFYLLTAVFLRVSTFQSQLPTFSWKGHKQKVEALYDGEMIYELLIMLALDLKSQPDVYFMYNFIGS